MRESEAYPELYQESAARKTKDKAVNILQGRCVGGGTTVNWTSSFRTPAVTLRHWASQYGLAGFGVADMAPWFARMEQRLEIAPWDVPPNANNEALARGAAKLGIASGLIRRNVRGCWNLGYCGMGCPINAKLAMLVTTIPGALERGATLVTRARAQKFVLEGDRVTRLDVVAMDAAGVDPTARRVTVRARAFVAAAGAIGTPALLLRSGTPDPHGVLGKRTFLHPVLVCAARMPERIDPYYGAPQSVYSDHFLDTMPPEGPMGYKLEAPPVHPILGAITLPGYGAAHAAWMRDLPHMHVLLALTRDGFHPESPGGTVALRSDGTPVLDYPLNAYFFDAARARVPDHGRTAVRRRRDAGDAGSRRRRRVLVLGAGARRHRRVRARATGHAGGVGARDGRRSAGPGPQARGGRSDRAPSPARQPARAGRLAVSHLGRRQSAAVDLRAVGTPRRRPRRVARTQALTSSRRCRTVSSASGERGAPLGCLL